MKQLRGPKHENWPVCDPRAAPHGEYGLKSGENGHLARANGAIDGPYCSPAWPSVCVEGGVSRWLVGAVGLGAELHQRPHAARGAFLQFEWLRKTCGAQAFAPPLWRRAWLGWLAKKSRGRGGGGGEKSRCFATTQALSNVEEENHSSTCCARTWPRW
jgi:hypothetical protein